ncbi:integrin alpha-PS3-like [Drosophila biarmipes]|uniref:integrin alpha-PS3-like n=1 Tax=Drosophila biarmipes TaxID=125945 RepID=UPI0007E7385B|nr:integrin alpha-PS3-like [Drosophila biarmipes]
MCRILFFAFMALVYQMEAFNISPHPSLVINYPSHLNTSQRRSSYFGYSLVIRPTSVIVGAPRSESTLPLQKNIDEPGAIFKCNLTSGSCSPYVLDPRGDVDNYNSKCTTNNFESKGFQWLGGSMDGGTRDTDKLIVCAPRLYARSYERVHMIGTCYWVKDTHGHTSDHVTRISPLRLKSKQLIEGNVKKGILGKYVYMNGEMGLSAHVPEDNSRFLIGAPGIDNWKGSIILDYPEDNSENHLMEKDFAKTCHLEHNKTKIPETQSWQEEDSYFGYAVSSGYFDSASPNTLLYVATAPQANVQAGGAYIFDFTDNGRSIQKIKDFYGEQFGEYFGYSVLAEDLNGDGRTDVIVSAPQHALADSQDIGAIYVFINKGSYEFEETIIHSPGGSKGRFGTTLSRIGDINQDGFNDVAVGAPFAGNGSVFIYLGSEEGLQEQPSQRLDAPSQRDSFYGAHMFGHGLSRGSDIDDNGFNDFVIGAPNAEVSYLYKAYPVVRVIAELRPESREVKQGKDKITIAACYRLDTKAKKMQEQELNIRISIDKQLGRAKFPESQTDEICFQATAGLKEICREFKIKLRFGSVFTPIVLEMHYELTNKVSDSEEFCETCALVDPQEPTVSSQKIIFSTGCAADVCIADLQLRSKNVSPTYVLGSADTLRIDYKITNNGENAYLPQFNVTSTSSLAFAQVPGNCRVTEAVMTCDLNHGRHLAKSDSDSVTISFDVSKLSGQSLIIHAEVFSAGLEKNPTDNKQTNAIGLKEFTEIDASGGHTNDRIVLKKAPNITEVVNQYEIKSRGPSTIEELTVALYIPVAYKTDESVKAKPIIDVSSLKLQVKYDSQAPPVKVYDQNNGVLSATRKRRDVERLKGVQEISAGISNVQDNAEESLPISNTIVFNCQDTNSTICLRAEMRLKFRPHKPINLNIRFNLDLNEMRDDWEYFVIKTDLRLLKKGDPTSSSLKINKRIKSNVISNHSEVSRWNIILSVIGGILLLSAISYTLYKHGFFERAKKEELKKLIRQSVEALEVAEDEEAEDEEADDMDQFLGEVI